MTSVINIYKLHALHFSISPKRRSSSATEEESLSIDLNPPIKEETESVSQTQPFLMDHIKDGITVRRYLCTLCDTSYTRSNKLKGHLLNKHGSTMFSLSGHSSNFRPKRQRRSVNLSHKNRETAANPLPKKEQVLSDVPKEKEQDEEAPVASGGESDTSREYSASPRLKKDDPQPPIERRMSRALAAHGSFWDSELVDGRRRYICRKCHKSYTRTNKLRGHLLLWHGISMPSLTMSKLPLNHLTDGTALTLDDETVAESSQETGNSSLALHSDTLDREEVSGQQRKREDNEWNDFLLKISEPITTTGGKRQRTYKCPECSEKFCRTNAIRMHMLKQHNRTVPYKVIDTSLKTHLCHECGKGFVIRDSLKKHIASLHAPPSTSVFVY